MRDLRKYSKNTTLRLVLGFFALLIVVGLGLVFFIYGKGAFVSGLLCILGGLVPVALIFFALLLVDLIVKKNREE